MAHGVGSKDADNLLESGWNGFPIRLLVSNQPQVRFPVQPQGLTK
jgi:hypothetical protein